ncbi:MAG: trigger factor, partial [Anaerolineaceae bacterium]|nr:trigger factor [Anaerolineaceae bacterium]
TLDKEEFAPYMNKAARKIAGSQRIPGFRPGKAPANVIRNMFGEMAIAQEAFDMFLEEKYGAILAEAGVEPGAMGKLENIEDVITPKFSMVVPLKATVDLGDYRSIREDYAEEEVTEDEIQKMLKDLKEPYSTQEPFEGEIEDGCLVFAMIKGDLDEPMEEGGTTELVKEMPYQFIVGSDNDEGTAWPYPKFTQCLLGHKEGDVVTSEYTYPEDSPIESLKGHKASYTTTIQSVKKMVLPENDDEFAKNFGKDTFADLMEEIKKSLAENKKRAEENKYIEAVVDKMSDIADIKYSASELQNEVDERLEELKHNLQDRGIGFDAWLKMKKTDEGKFIEEEIKPVAEKQLRRKLIMSEFAKEEKIQLNYEEFKKKHDELVEYMQPRLQQAKNKHERDHMMQHITDDAFNETYMGAVFGRLISIAKGENPPIEDPAENAAKAAAEAAAEIEAEKAAEENTGEAENKE